MPITKEFHCDECARDFEGFIAICSRCGKSARRVFLTAPGFPKGVAKRTDRILASEFKKRGIVNFSNAGERNRVWVSTGETSSVTHGLAQQPIQPIFGNDPNQLARIPGYNPAAMTIEGKPYQLPDLSKISTPPIPMGTKVGQKPTELLSQTFVKARADKNGNVTQVNGHNGR